MGVDVKAVRHTVKLPVNAFDLFDALTRFCYTRAIDPYLHAVKLLEEIPIDNVSKGVSWCHVSYTADKFPSGMSMRNFVSFDFCNFLHLLYFSRSCYHPDCPASEKPSWLPHWDKRAYRVPFEFCQRVIPDESDTNNFCTLIQFQFIDLGGVLSPSQQQEAVIKFGAKISRNC